MPQDKGQAEDAEAAKKAEERAQAAEQLRTLVGERIRALAKRRKVSLRRLPAEAGISRATLYSVLQGKTPATTDTLAKLAYALGVEPIELLRAPRAQRPKAGAR